jgi:hypothetical protein
MRLQDHLQDDLRDAYGKSAALACEQIAAIRTVASLRREPALLGEFVESMADPVRKALISTAKSTFVSPSAFVFLTQTPVLRFQSGCTAFHQRSTFLVRKYTSRQRGIQSLTILRLYDGRRLWGAGRRTILFVFAGYHKSNVGYGTCYEASGTSARYRCVERRGAES